MSVWLSEDALNVEVGLALWALSLWLPLRAFASRPEFAWDLLGGVCSSIFALGVTMGLDEGYDIVTDIGWIGEWQDVIGALEGWQLLILNVVAVDFALYWGHRLLHTRFLWSTHAWHHAPRVLYWLSGLRGSPIHILALYGPATLMFVVFPTPETGAVSFATVLIDVLNQHFIHSNLRVPYPRQLEWLFVTPRYHFVHHSTTIERANSNYGFIFSCWDRLFGTYTDPATVPAEDPLGLGYEESNWRLLFGLPSRAAPSVARSVGHEQPTQL